MIKPKELLQHLATREVAVACVCLIIFSITLLHPFHLHSPAKRHIRTEATTTGSGEVLQEAQNLGPARTASEGNIDDAIAEATKELNEHPNDIATVICAGNLLSQYGDKEKGFALLKDSLSLAPDNLYVHLNYARRLAQEHRTTLAIEQYLTLCKIYTKELEPHYELANLYLNAGKATEAIEYYKGIVDNNANHTFVRKNYGLALAATGNEKEGFANFVEACSVARDEASYATIAKAVLKKNGDIERKAIGDMKIEIATKPRQVIPRVIYAQLLLYLGKNAEAKELAEEALKLDSHNTELYMILAEADLKLDKKDEALQAFKQAVSSLPAKS